MSPEGIHIIIMSKIIHLKASDNDSDKEDENVSSNGSLQDTDGEEESKISAGHLILLTSARSAVNLMTKSSKQVCFESWFSHEYFSELLALPRKYRLWKENFRERQRLKHF